MPETFIISSIVENGPCSCRYAAIAAALALPTPGIFCSSCSSARLILIFPAAPLPSSLLFQPEEIPPCPEAAEPAADNASSPFDGTRIFCPSSSRQARFRPAVSASSEKPPAASTAIHRRLSPAAFVPAAPGNPCARHPRKLPRKLLPAPPEILPSAQHRRKQS